MNTNVAISEKESACVLIYNPSNGMFLAVTRKEDITQIGLPGGKRDASDNTVCVTAIREMFEETGLQYHLLDLKCLHHEQCGDYYSYAFYVEYDETLYGEPTPKEVGVTPVWVYADDLIENSPFGEFNSKVIDKFLDRYI